MHYVIDAINGRFARLEAPDRTTMDVPLHELPPDAQEGDLVAVRPEGGYRRMPEETRRRAAQIRALMERLRE